MKALRVIISGGGTGGHIFPALSIAGKLKEINPETEIAYAAATGLRTETGTRQRYGNPVYFSIVIGRIPATVRRQQSFISGYEMRRTQHCPSLCIYLLHTDIAGHASSSYHPGLSGCPNLNPFLSLVLAAMRPLVLKRGKMPEKSTLGNQ